jgi:EAL domain-containing protein (putative c-di-GMP-specific phosphodiesterase class I)
MAEVPLTQRFAAGAELFREGEPADCAYILQEGRLEVSQLHGGAKEVVAELNPGDLFGELALIQDGVRSATVTALEPPTVAVILREQLDAAMQDADPVIKLFLRTLVERFHSGKLRLRGVTRASPYKRRAYDADLAHTVRDLQLREELQRALQEREFELHYQPIVELTSGAIAGYEALIRWRHPERGLVSPAEFVGFAEKHGQIVPIGAWVMDEACAAAARLGAMGGPECFVSLNVSARQLTAEGFVEQAERSLEQSGADPAWIKFEITESLLMSDPESAAALLAEIKMLGVRLALDDFGTGYSSLGYLHRYPFDTLKIDRAFVTTMLRSNDSMEIVRCILGMATGLRLEVVAEGIENAEELATLAGLGCTYGQGYHFARPQPEADAFALRRR